jgi:hypothetical protein
VTLEDGDGTTARFVDGQRGIEITATGTQISMEGPPDDFVGDHAVETSDPGFDTDGGLRCGEHDGYQLPRHRC